MTQQKCQTSGAAIKDKSIIRVYKSVFCYQACLDKWNEIVLGHDKKFYN